HNAGKFTPQGGWAAVELTAAGGQAHVRVRDSGRGIAPEKLARIFEPFAQSEAGDAARGGLGIGLALVKQVMELHGGAVGGPSEGRGSGDELVLRVLLSERVEAMIIGETAAQRTATGNVGVVSVAHDII